MGRIQKFKERGAKRRKLSAYILKAFRKEVTKPPRMTKCRFFRKLPSTIVPGQLPPGISYYLSSKAADMEGSNFGGKRDLFLLS